MYLQMAGDAVEPKPDLNEGLGGYNQSPQVGSLRRHAQTHVHVWAGARTHTHTHMQAGTHAGILAHPPNGCMCRINPRASTGA